MSFYIFNRKSLIKAGICAFMLVLTSAIILSAIGSITSVSAEERKIPIYCVKQDKKVVSISFDAAWGNEQTQTLLDILDKYKVKSTFFLVGEWVDKYPESVKAISEAGHDVGSHSDKHDHMPTLSYEQIISDTKSSCEKIEKITGKKTILYRPPYGDYNNTLVQGVNDCDLYCVQWDVDSLDWKDPTPEQMVERIISKISNGSIILMHNGAKNTPEALPMIIEAIQKEGYTIVPISEILLKGQYATDHEGRMYLTGPSSDNDTKSKADSDKSSDSTAMTPSDESANEASIGDNAENSAANAETEELEETGVRVAMDNEDAID